jgi:superkiller protein 3
LHWLAYLFCLGFVLLPGQAVAQGDEQGVESEETVLLSENQFQSEQAETAFLKGVMYFSQDRPKEALAELSRTLELESGCAEARLLRAICHLKMDTFEEAKEDFDHYVTLDSNKGESLNIIGKLLYMYGYFEEAERFFRRALEHEPESAVVYSNLGSVLIERGKRKEAETAFLKAVSLDIKFSEAYENLGILYFVEGRYSAAESAFQQAVALNREEGVLDPISYANLGDLYFTLGELELCIENYYHALEINPDLAGVRTRAGIAWHLKGETTRAREEYEMAITSGGEPPEAHSKLAVLYMDEGRINAAVNEYRKAIQYSGSLDPDPMKALGRIMKRMERYHEAFRLYENAFHLGDRTPDVLASLSVLAEEQGRREESLQYFRVLLESDWDDPTVLLEIARRCAGSRIHGIRDPETAVSITKQLTLDLGWDHPGVMHVMATAYANMGDFKSAAHAQSQAIASLPEDNPLTLSLLGRLEEYKINDE